MLGYLLCRIMRLDTPLRLFTKVETETLGGVVHQQMNVVVFPDELHEL